MRAGRSGPVPVLSTRACSVRRSLGSFPGSPASASLGAGKRGERARRRQAPVAVADWQLREARQSLERGSAWREGEKGVLPRGSGLAASGPESLVRGPCRGQRGAMPAFRLPIPSYPHAVPAEALRDTSQRPLGGPVLPCSPCPRERGGVAGVQARAGTSGRRCSVTPTQCPPPAASSVATLGRGVGSGP